MRSRSAYREHIKKEVKHVFGSVRWDYIKTCKHDMNVNRMYCPMCLLVRESTTSHFLNEKEQRMIAKQNAIKTRGRLRYLVLQCWSRNQSRFYGDVLPRYGLELGFTDATVLSLYSLFSNAMHYIEPNEHLSRLLKLLQRRKRIIEIGIYAATMIQKTVRSYCCRRRLIRFALKRFELVYSKKGDYYNDKLRGRTLRRRPHILKFERPGSPRTILRRLTAIETKQKYCQKVMDEIKEKNVFADGENIWSVEAKYIKQLRQLLLLRDVLAMAFENIEKQAQGSPRQNAGMAWLGGNEVDDMQQTPVFLSFSPPLPSVRRVTLAIAIARDQKKQGNHGDAQNERSAVTGHTKPTVTQTKIPNSTADNSLPHILGGGHTHKDNTMESQKTLDMKPHMTATNISATSLNSRLAALEQHAWDISFCRSPEEVIQVLACSEIQAALGSSILIAGDECRVWNGDQVLVRYENKLSLEKDEEDEEDDDDEGDEVTEEAEIDEEDKVIDGDGGMLKDIEQDKTRLGASGPKSDTARTPFMREPTLVLPVHVQLCPAVPLIKRPSDVFRLIFKNGELSAVTPLSPWVYYKHVASRRDEIVQSILSYVQSPTMTTLIKTMMIKANTNPNVQSDHIPTASSRNNQNATFTSNVSSFTASSSQRVSGSQRRLPPLTDDRNSSSASLPYRGFASESIFVPTEGNIFGNATYKSAHLSDQDVERLTAKYKFLQRLPAWCTRLKHVRLKGASAVNDMMPVDEEEEEEYEVDGEEVYQLCPPSSLNDPNQTYESSLHHSALRTSINLQERICLPMGAAEDGIPDTPGFGIVAVDVYIELPTSTSPTKHSRGKQPVSVALGGDLFPVDIHRVVGVFTSESTRQPSTLDLGLFSWNFFCENKLILTQSDDTAATEAHEAIPGDEFLTNRDIDWSSNIQQRREGLPVLEPLNKDITVGQSAEESWSKINASSGVSVLRRVMPSSGLVAEVRFICAAPTQEYLQRRLPVNIRGWLATDALVPSIP